MRNLITLLNKHKNIIICGTDTDVGKTFVGCSLVSEFRKQNLKVGVFKPFESGIVLPRDIKKSDSGKLFKAASLRGQINLTPENFHKVCFHALKLPAAPAVAAELENKKLNLKTVVQKIKVSIKKEKFEKVFLELAGGLLVPINQKETNLDLIKNLNWPVLLISANKLGTINHTLLTLEKLKQSRVKVIAVYLNNLKKKPPVKGALKNSEQIQKFTKVKVLES
jgi:dethiobiotin synthase